MADGKSSKRPASAKRKARRVGNLLRNARIKAETGFSSLTKLRNVRREDAKKAASKARREHKDGGAL